MFLLSPSQKRGFLAFLTLLLVIMGGKMVYKQTQQNLSTYSISFPEGEQKNIHTIGINAADTTQWASLPFIGAVLSKRIVKYREVIGGFADVATVGKVYGLKPDVFEKILPFLVLDSIPEEIKKGKKNYTDFADTYPDKKDKKDIPILDINTASEGDFALLPGIGTVLSERIVKFRDAKKGFHSVEEVGKVYGLKPEAFAEILPFLTLKTPAATQPEKPAFVENKYPQKFPKDTSNEKPVFLKKSSAIIDLNKADTTALQQVAGIGAYTAKQIVATREAIGGFAEISHLKFVKGVSEENFLKMKPFLQITNTPTKKNINKVSFSTLEKYPSLQKENVSKFITYRKLNGYFTTWEEVSKAEGMNAEMLAILKVYFVIE